jgi:aminomethyltransferase
VRKTTWGKVAGLYNVLIARTGYTGEDGFEIYVPSDVPTSEKVWKAVFEAGEEFGIQPAGLGARNTLRLESSMALYGHEISDTINVFEARLTRYCKLDKEADFVGKQVLSEIERPARELVGLEMVERGIARDGYPVRTLEGELIGVVTSGSPSPTLKTNIAMAFVPINEAAHGNEVAVEIRGALVRAKVVATPFYKRTQKPAEIVT